MVLSKFRMDTAVVGGHLNCGFVIPACCEGRSIPLLSYLRVCELAPVVLGRGRHPSPFCHTCVSVAGIHPKGNQDGFPIKNAGNDNLTPSSPQVVSGGYVPLHFEEAHS